MSSASDNDDLQSYWFSGYTYRYRSFSSYGVVLSYKLLLTWCFLRWLWLLPWLYCWHDRYTDKSVIYWLDLRRNQSEVFFISFGQSTELLFKFEVAACIKCCGGIRIQCCAMNYCFTRHTYSGVDSENVFSQIQCSELCYEADF